jgi:SAM-dependent methyltransferase
MTTNKHDRTADVCSYEGSQYRTEFWEGQGRDYEDRTERVALRRLMPTSGVRLLEVGAGFGRLTREFDGFQQVILLDYSRTLLQEAQQLLGAHQRFVFVAADLYHSPIADASCDAATMIRVLHHMVNAPAALHQVRQALTPGATFVLEYANKRNLKAMLQFMLNQREDNPYTLKPYEFVELNFNFHPAFIRHILTHLGFDTTRTLALSYLRIGLLKRMVPVRILVMLDALLQHSSAVYNASPSVFTRNILSGTVPSLSTEQPLFKCPACGTTPLDTQPDYLHCSGCGAKWSRTGGIFDFKSPLNA